MIKKGDHAEIKGNRAALKMQQGFKRQSSFHSFIFHNVM